MMATVATIACGFYLVPHGHWLTLLVLSLIVLGNWIGVFQILFLPLTLALHFWEGTMFSKRTGIGFPMAHSDRLFVYLCNIRARKLGVELDWDAYDRTRRGEQAEPT